MTEPLHPIEPGLSRCAWTADVGLTDNEPPSVTQGVSCTPDSMGVCENPDDCSNYIRTQTLVEVILAVIVESGWKEWLVIMEEPFGMLKL